MQIKVQRSSDQWTSRVMLQTLVGYQMCHCSGRDLNNNTKTPFVQFKRKNRIWIINLWIVESLEKQTFSGEFFSLDCGHDLNNKRFWILNKASTWSTYQSFIHIPSAFKWSEYWICNLLFKGIPHLEAGCSDSH